jgi:hypothetical protein
MVNLNIKVDSNSFDKAYKDYIGFSKKSLEDIANKTVFEIAKIATTTTKTTPKEQIASELRQGANSYNAPLAAILVNKQRGNKGKKGLFGPVMAKAVESLIKRRQRTAKFVAAGWIAAVRAIAPFVKDKTGALMPVGKPKSSLGGALPARNINNKASAVIWNNVFGGKGKGSKPARVTAVELDGLTKAVNIKVKDMYVYINRKLSEGARRFNR